MKKAEVRKALAERHKKVVKYAQTLQEMAVEVRGMATGDNAIAGTEDIHFHVAKVIRSAYKTILPLCEIYREESE